MQLTALRIDQERVIARAIDEDRSSAARTRSVRTLSPRRARSAVEAGKKGLRPAYQHRFQPAAHPAPGASSIRAIAVPGPECEPGNRLE